MIKTKGNMVFHRVEKTKNYTSVLNSIIREKKLSQKAKATLIYLLSLSDDWVLYKNKMLQEMADGKDSLNSALDELVKNGYLIMSSRRVKGKSEITYEVFEDPKCCGNSAADDTQREIQKSDAENTQIQNTYLPKKKTTTTAFVDFLKNIADEKGISSSCFSPKLISFLLSEFNRLQMDVDLQKECIEWILVYATERCKDERKFVGYLFKSIYKTNLVQLFLDEKASVNKQELQRKQRTSLSCPICGSLVSIGTTCDCGLEYYEFSNPEKVRFHRRLINLSPQQRAEYESAHDKIYTNSGISSVDLQNRTTEIEKLNRKFGLID